MPPSDESPPEFAPPGRLRRLLDRFAVNRAVSYLVLARIWQVCSAPVTLVLLTAYFSDELLGYYWVINSWLMMQVFAELGLPFLLSVQAGHEWHKLRLDASRAPGGDPVAMSRLASLNRFALLWFGTAAALFLFIVGGLGWLNIGERRGAVDWQWPWLGVMTMNAISLTLLPRLAILEGCNQVTAINRMRFWQALTGSFAVWACILLGGKLWTLVASNLVRLLWEAALVWGVYRRFFRTLDRHPITTPISYRDEIRPLQWRMAIQNMASFYSTGFLTLVVDRFWGKIEAGRMGMTWNLLSTIQTVSFAWVQTRLPQLAMHVAAGERRQLDALYRRIGLASWGAYLAGLVAFCLGLEFLEHFAPPQFRDKFLPYSPVLLLSAGLAAQLVTVTFQMYVRVHKKDPFLWVNTLGSLGVGVGAWLLGKPYGAIGVAAAYAAVAAGFVLPCTLLILARLRQHLATTSPVSRG